MSSRDISRETSVPYSLQLCCLIGWFVFLLRRFLLKLWINVHKVFDSDRPCDKDSRLEFDSDLHSDLDRGILPSDTTDFSSLQRFRKSVSTEYLTHWCKLNFT